MARAQAAADVPAELHVIDAGDALEAMLSIATGRLMRLRERHALQLDAGDVGLVRLEGEAIDRVTRVAKIVLDSGLAERRDRLARRSAEVFAALFEQVVAVADVTPEVRGRMVAVLVEGIERFENTPAEALDTWMVCSRRASPRHERSACADAQSRPGVRGGARRDTGLSAEERASAVRRYADSLAVLVEHTPEDGMEKEYLLPALVRELDALRRRWEAE